MTNYTDAEIEAMWTAGNNEGAGYAVGEDGMSPIESAEFEEFADIRTFDTSMNTGTCVIARDGDAMVAICDCNGPWAVTIAQEAM